MIEAEARDLLRQYDGIGGIEAWIAGQPWRPAPNGWTIARELQGWRFHIRTISGGLQIYAVAHGGGPPALWMVLSKG